MTGKKMLLTALGMGAVYLMKNKEARQKVIHQVQSFTNKAKQKA